MKNKKIIGRIIMTSAVLIGFIETAYFGFNLTPESDLELGLDIGVLVLFTIGVIVYKWEK